MNIDMIVAKFGSGSRIGSETAELASVNNIDLWQYKTADHPWYVGEHTLSRR